MTSNRLKISASLWSANLVKLESEIRRVEPCVDSFHIDVADGTYGKLMLFFPDLVAAIRSVTEKPLEVHLITRNPQRWVEEFAEAGANCIVFYADSTEAPQAMIDHVKSQNLSVGISLPVEEEVAAVDRFLDQVNLIVVMGTSSGVKGVPTTAFLVLMTLFTIIIGPVNYIFLVRRKQQYLLLITIPVFALMTSLSLFGYSVVAHGFGVKSRLRSMTILDQQSRTAVTTSRIAL